VAGVVAHPPDPEDGVIYESVFTYAAQSGWPVIRSRGRDDPEFLKWLPQRSCDVILVADYRYLLAPEVVALAPSGAINLHPSLLPKYRGRAPINWAILHGETELGLTAHMIDNEMDTGDILAQKRFTLRLDQDVGDALGLLYPLYAEITTEVLCAVEERRIIRRVQDDREATVFPARKPADGLIDWSKPAIDVLNLVRAVAPPYPGAFAFQGSTKVVIEKAALTITKLLGKPGMVLETHPLTIACGSGALVIKRWRTDPAGVAISAGASLVG
jgi:methionyl-tRNA formyltransferase